MKWGELAHQVNFFPKIHSIWLNKNAMIFSNNSPTVIEMAKETKILAWSWLRGKVLGFIYPLSNWLNNPTI